MTDECIDLKKLLGDRFRVRAAETHRAETGSTVNNNRDPWHWLVLGSRGHICPWGGSLLAVCLNDRHTMLAKRLMREPWVDRSRSMVGDDAEVNAVFDVSDIEKALPFIRPYRRKRFSEAAREKASSRLRAFRLRRDAFLGAKTRRGGSLDSGVV